MHLVITLLGCSEKGAAPDLQGTHNRLLPFSLQQASQLIEILVYSVVVHLVEADRVDFFTG